MLDSDNDGAFFATRHGRLVRIATRLLADRAEAEDAVQDSYLRALDATQDGAGIDIDIEQAWLTTVVQNLAIDRLRRRDWMRDWLGRAAAEPPPETPSAEIHAALAQQVERALRHLVRRLDAHDGAVLLLREVFEASYREIAEVTGNTEAASRQQVHRALLRVRQGRGTGDERRMPTEREAAASKHADDADALLQLYRQALLERDMRPLLAILRHAPARAQMVDRSLHATGIDAVTAPKTVCRLIQVGGRLGLALSLGDRFVCVLPLGATPADPKTPLALEDAGAFS